jgi:hypothetical protein
VSHLHTSTMIRPRPDLGLLRQKKNTHIQGVRGEKFNIFAGDNVGHSKKKKSSYEHVSNLERLPRYNRFNLHDLHTYLC